MSNIGSRGKTEVKTKKKAVPSGANNSNNNNNNNNDDDDSLSDGDNMPDDLAVRLTALRSK